MYWLGYPKSFENGIIAVQVFYDHLHEQGLSATLKTLIQLRKRQQIHCKSSIEVLKCENNMYAAKIDDRTVIKLGGGDFHPGSGWNKACSGNSWVAWTHA